MEKLVFSQAKEADIPVIADILTDATQYKLRHEDTSWGQESWSCEEIKERMDNGYSFYLVTAGDKAIGTTSLSWRDKWNWGDRPSDAGYVHQLAVRGGYHGEGVGAKVLNWLAGEVAKSGRKFLRLDCDSNNQALCKYYEGQGFKKVGASSRPDNEIGLYEASLYEKMV